MTLTLTAIQPADPAPADWSITEEPEMWLAARHATTAFVRAWAGVAEWDDVHQEARIILAERAPSFRVAFAEGGRKLVTYRLKCRLRDRLATDLKRKRRTESLDARQERAESAGA